MKVDELEKLVVDEWQEYLDLLKPAATTMAKLIYDTDDEQLRREVYGYGFSMLANGYISLVHGDPEYPDFLPMWNNVFNQIFPNPDNLYHTAFVNGDGIYRISGYRGSSRMAFISVSGGPFIPRGEGEMGPVLANYDIDELEIGNDGYFEVLLSEERPEECSGNWLKLHKDASWLLIRQYLANWRSEASVRVAIDRLDRPASRPRSSASKRHADLKQIGIWLKTWMRMPLELQSDGRRESQQNANNFRITDFVKTGGAPSISLPECYFNLGSEDALLVEAELPADIQYWGFHMVDDWYRTIDPMRQTSLNAHTARMDTDGKLRFIVSVKDPGVPNWLDTVDWHQGFIYGRYFKFTGTVCAPKTRVVPVGQVRSFLPDDTPVITPEARDATVRERRRSIQLRGRW